MVTRIPTANLKGAKGDKGNQGNKGDQGLPGVNAVPASEAVGAYILDLESDAGLAVAERIAQQHKDTLALTRLERETQSMLTKLNGQHLKRALTASVWTEDWSDLAAWTPGVGMNVGSGRMWGTAGVQRPIHVAAGESWWGRTTLHVSGESGADKTAYFGVTNQPDGWVPVAGDTKGIYHGITGTGVPGFYKGTEVSGATPGYLNEVLPAGDYLATIAIDADEILFSFQAEDWSGVLYSNRILRSQMPGGPEINLVALSSKDTTGASGITWGPLVTCDDLTVPLDDADRAPGGHVLLGPGKPIMFQTKDAVTGVRRFVLVPGNYDPRVPADVLSYMHWSLSATAVTPFLDARFSPLLHAYEAAGLIFVASDNGPGTTNGGTQDKWGNQAGQDDYNDAVNDVREMFATNRLFLQGDSLGGQFVQNILARREMGGIAGVISICPSTNFAPLLPHATYGPLIRAAYDATTNEEFWTNVAGYNPSDHSAASLRGVDQLFIGATDDAIVPVAAHITPIADKLDGWATVEVHTRTGGHIGAILYSTYTPNIIAFINRIRGRS